MTTEETAKLRGRRRGIYLLPNLLTTAGLFAGFYAILAATNNRFESAAIAVFFAMILDGFDGRVARWTNTESDFGAEYDSLADMVSFGLAPALVMYEYALSSLGKLGWMAAFIYTAGAALRLARFNTQVGISDKRYFQGLASPSAAAIVVGLVWVGHELVGSAAWLNIVALILTITAGILMVSNIRYYSFKGYDFRSRVDFISIVVIVLVIAVVFTNPPLVLFAVFLLYSLSGPLFTLIELRKRRQQRKASQTSGTDQDTTDLENSQ